MREGEGRNTGEKKRRITEGSRNKGSEALKEGKEGNERTDEKKKERKIIQKDERQKR